MLQHTLKNLYPEQAALLFRKRSCYAGRVKT